MSKDIKITRIAVTQFSHEFENLSLESRYGFDLVYKAGATLSQKGSILTIETSAGVSGQTLGGIDDRTARYLLGRNPLDREIIWHDLKRSNRVSTGAPPGEVDIALWDFAGKLYGAPVYELLGGGWRKKLPAYASTYHGDENGGLTTPGDFAQFAKYCKDEYGYPAFKIHGWVNGPIDREIDAVLAIREAVGEKMDLLLDPAGAFQTFEDVLKVGRAVDEARYMWYEDPFRGGGFSRFAHAKLRELIKTPMLMGEHVRGLEAKADTIYTGATDFVRANANADGGITGVMKLASLAEAHGLDVELHGGSLAHRHVMSTLRNANYYELGLVHPKIPNTKPPIYNERRWLDELDSVDENGCVEVPEGPGLGVQLDWDYIKANQTGEGVYE
ncbi:MAG: D-galactarolactone cycloisomerase [Candidatus Moanabacter tarae]|uniref:D-galactarolactone cycloisomerase n=1 Tax=Candidatus Moanibacter tarae TaxID=2200854 RepID=A0A2Z4ADL9_9BACT|nr:MAG: D-galactarolactone cycloisomerase [Candidatus Moanabacter tarae]|tara:strand:- start:2759 stop:3919 length:1161 start_codon:yes stop_codon:yes gene_type:complete